MQIITGAKEFIFLNALPALVPSVKHVLDHTGKCIKDTDYLNDILFRVKSVVTELFTNACKHSGTETVKLTVDINDDYISITKIDDGHPFNRELLVHPEGEKKLLAYDVMHNLYALTDGENTIKFIAEESDNEQPDINNITEHFGLLIITKCANEFLYHYDRLTGQNVFTVKISLIG
ncbi:hypothetical protein EOD41_01875 [Mucilaginibacter limnophilus]|uniref:Uncharacterized protein n=1 Tax=Mucilaginibacter limnophilus TaxID=1932778 RepID=A0A437MYJ5_9SPHI|nr:ATP-binding protein [Mucilaginibacter limnophilus]RVU02713.1 hypothetical protein EOD41_01875 [Mucilaginibacter limnophilus]